MNIILTGYRGTGKSATAQILSQLMGFEQVEMDARIREVAGLTIPQIVESFGWPHFRDLETQIARELAQQDMLIIDAGGGIVERPENLAALRPTGPVCWLRASVSTIVSRIGRCTDRPALSNGKTFLEEIAEVLERRTPLYQASADFQIETDLLTPDEIARQISDFFHTFRRQDP